MLIITAATVLWNTKVVGDIRPVMTPTSMDSISVDHIHPLLMELTGILLKVITTLSSTQQ